MTTTYKSTPITEGLFFPEGLRWAGGEVLYGDIIAARFGVMAPDGARTVRAQFTSPCSGIGTLADGSAVVSLMQERKLMRVGADGAVSVHCDLAPLGMDHINDIISDKQGRVYVDALSYHLHWLDPEEVSGETLYRFRNDATGAGEEITDALVLVDTDGSARVVAEGLVGPNGLAITGDGQFLIVSEWRANRLSRYRIAADGSLEDREVFAELPGMPDGICVDAEDAIWVASPSLGCCLRVSKTGEILDRVEITGKRATSCVLGDDDRRTLYITTDEMPALPTGRIETVRVKVPGVGYP